MRIASFTRFGCALALLCFTAGAAWSAKSPTNAILRYEVQISQGKKPAQKMVRKIWLKGKRYRVEVTGPAGTQIIVGGPKGAYFVSPESKEATHVPQPATSKDGFWVGLFGDTAQMRREKKVGKEIVNGRQTEIFEQRLDGAKHGVAPGVKGTTRVWLAPGLPMPLKAITKVEPNMKTVTLLKSMQLGATIPDSTFELPKNISVRPPVMLPGMLPADKVLKGALLRRK